MTQCPVRHRPIRPLPRIPALLAVALAALSPGCADDTGILIEVTHGELDVAPDTLRFFVGVRPDDLVLRVEGCGSGVRFVDSAALAENLAPVADRDLVAEPYRLLLRPGAELAVDQPLMVAVGALRDGEVVGLAALPGPAQFMDGAVLSWTLTMQPPRNADNLRMSGAGCVCAALSSDETVVLVPVDDWDCDGDKRPDDCDDNDPSVGPSKPEICDNQRDDNCNGIVDEEIDADGDGFSNCEDCNDTNPDVYPGAPLLCDGFANDCDHPDRRHPEHVECFTMDDEDCYLAKRDCNDKDPLAGGWENECYPTVAPHARAPKEVCTEFDRCAAELPYKDALECAIDRQAVAVACEVLVYQVDGEYRPCGGGVILRGPDLDEGCRWTLIDDINQREYSVALHAENATEDLAVIEVCQPTLEVRRLDEPTSPPLNDRFLLWLELQEQHAGLLHLQVTPRLVDALECEDSAGLVCPDLPAYPFER